MLRGKIETAFLSVYLPLLLLTPDGYYCRLPHLPPISAAQAALIPLGIAALFRRRPKGFPNFLDLLILLFLISTSISEVLKENILNDGIFSAIMTCVSIGLTYVVGRNVADSDLRLVTIKRITILLLLLGPVGLIEWRLGQNIYGVLGMKLFGVGTVHPQVQIRAGHGRMSGSFNDAELAGIAFALGAVLNVCLFYWRKWSPASTQILGKRFSWMEKYHIPGLVLLLYIYLSQSRGPMIAVAAGYLIVQIPRFKNKRTAMILVALILCVGGIAAFTYFKSYTNVSSSADVKNEQQGSALYRRRMNELYVPIVKQGGMFGWSMLSRPILPSMASIDNEFLLVHIAYGDAGYVLLILIVAESLRRTIKRCWTARDNLDQAFAFSLLAALSVLWVSLTTVYMGEQIPQLAFLLIGWTRLSAAPSALQVAGDKETENARFSFQRVFQ
ncbi:O-antigen ligase family protein [Acidicapsa dinghuensis]|uniref:O-antigen ligase family protein n=1 Tax=Acidicapsa dinghuensis TaxID=2218256 RepID=A0ABW1EC52_9BACT|nr:O-antigen ligase family protein [Acidicapsa dinghuensis]